MFFFFFFFLFALARLAREIAFAVEEMKSMHLGNEEYGGPCCEISFSSPFKSKKLNIF